MTNVSKRKLKNDFQDKLFQQLSKLVTSANKKQTEGFLSALFTESEKIMFIKRLAVILLLSKEHSAYRISQTLKMSESTVNNIRLKHEIGLYNSIISLAQKKEFDTEQFWNTIEILLRAGLPPRGKDRWKSTLRNLSR